MGVARFVCLMFALDFLLFGGVSAANVTRPVIERELLAPIDALVAAMNRSDDRSIAALMTRDAVIIDEVAPYRWTGSQAEEHWSHDDGLLISKRGVGASHSACGKPTFVHRDATHAYVIVPLAYDYTPGPEAAARDRPLDDRHGQNGAGWRIAVVGFAKTGDTSDSTWNG